MRRLAIEAQDQSRLLRGVRVSVRNDASAFSYSILVTATFGMTNTLVGELSGLRTVLFALGASSAFGLWEVVASRGFGIRVRGERSDVVLMGTAFAPISISAGLGGAWLLLQVVTGGWAWLLAPLVSTSVYTGLAGLQLALARKYEEQNPPEEQT